MSELPGRADMLCPTNFVPEPAVSNRSRAASLYPIGSSARASSASGISRPMAFAVLRLIVSSNFGQLGLLSGGHADAGVGDGKLDEAALYECIDECIASPLSKIVARQTYICRMLEAAVQAAVQATKISATSHGASARCSDGNACIGRPVTSVTGRTLMRNLLINTCFGAAVLVAGAANANEELIKMSQNPKDWVMPTGNYANHRYSQLKQITAENVGKLQVAWTFSTGVLRGHEGGPLVIGNVMYVHGPFPNPLYALDLNNDAKILWKYEPKQDPNVIPVMCCDTVNRGLAYADGKIFLHQADTTLVALDAKDGKVVWQAKNGDPAKGETGTSAPMVIKDKVLIGISGGEFGVQCHVTAYDLKTGRRAWRAFSEGPDDQILVDPVKTTDLGKPVGKDSSIKTWQGDQWKIGGGCTWGWISYDPQLNLFYYGSGNPSTWNPSQRPGDNKWSMTIFARNPDTGMAKWVYQMTPHDEWDYDGVNEMILTDQQIGGQNRKLLTHFDRNGLGYTLDRDTGELLVAEKFDPKVNWTSGVDMNKSSPT